MYKLSPNDNSYENHNANGWHSEQEQGVSVHTGFPNPAIDARLTGIDLNKLLIRHSAGTYLMRISGNAWAHHGVFDGDILVIDRVVSAHKNDMVVWWHDGDFAVSPRVRMRPDATVWGVVTTIIHQCRQQGKGGAA